MSNVKKKVNKNRIQPCIICKENHTPDIQVGNSVGDGGELAVSIVGDGNIQEYKEKHDLSNPRESVSRPPMIHYQLEAHHLICSESMDDEKEKGKYTWMDLCNCFGYDINCKENGVFLPSCMEVACAYKVPLHRGNHCATDGTEGANYVDSVKDLIKDIKKNGKKYCKNASQFKKDLDKISSDIFEFVKEFTWTITTDGRDYKGIIGCFNSKTFTEKRKKQLRVNNLSGDVKSVVKQATERSLLNRNLCCDPMNHNKKALKKVRVKYPLVISK